MCAVGQIVVFVVVFFWDFLLLYFLFVVVKNSPLFLYWQRYHVHSTYSEQYHRNQHSKMLSLSATLHLKDSHALHHEICSITHIYVGICIQVYIYIEDIYWCHIYVDSILWAVRKTYMYIYFKYINFIYFVGIFCWYFVWYIFGLYRYIFICCVAFRIYHAFWSGANNTRFFGYE